MVRFCGTEERLKVPVGTEIEFAAAGGGVVASLAAPSAADSDVFGVFLGFPLSVFPFSPLHFTKEYKDFPSLWSFLLKMKHFPLSPHLNRICWLGYPFSDGPPILL